MEIGPSGVRHEIRGTMHALKLCVSAFEVPLDPSEKLEFLADIESSADRLVSLLDEYEAFAPAPPSPATSPDGPVPTPASAAAAVVIKTAQ